MDDCKVRKHMQQIHELEMKLLSHQILIAFRLDTRF